MPLFAAAASYAPDCIEPSVALPPMAEAREVVEDYQSTGLSLRRHPSAFLRNDFKRAGMITCADLAAARRAQQARAQRAAAGTGAQ